MESPKLNEAAPFPEAMAGFEVIGEIVGTARVYLDCADVAAADEAPEGTAWQTVKLHLARYIIKSQHCRLAALQYPLKKIAHCLLLSLR